MLLRISVLGLQEVLAALNDAAPYRDDVFDPIQPCVLIGVNGRCGVGKALADEAPEPIRTAWIQRTEGKRSITEEFGDSHSFPYRMRYFLRGHFKGPLFLVLDWADAPVVKIQSGLDLVEALRIRSSFRVEMEEPERVGEFLRKGRYWGHNENPAYDLNQTRGFKDAVEKSVNTLRDVREACLRGGVIDWEREALAKCAFLATHFARFFAPWGPGGPLQPLS